MKRYGFTVLTTFEGKVQKKSVEEKQKSSFYEEVIKLLQDYTTRHNIEKIVLASPAFFKEDLLKLAPSELKKLITLATCNSTGNSGINEVLKCPEVKEVLKQDRISQEHKLVELVLSEISKDNLAAYGIKQVQEASDAGAIDYLLISDSFINKAREKGTYSKIETLMKNIDAMKASITIISSDHEGGKKLDGLGGIAAILRFKLTY